MLESEETIHSFYESLAKGDAEGMNQHYHPLATFSDPVFGSLSANEAQAMWRMLLSRAAGKLTVTHEILQADEMQVKARAIARYSFGPKKRKVINTLNSVFTFRDGKIFDQTDHFSFHRWASMALGFTGWLLGGTNYLRQKVRKSSLKLLHRYINHEGLK